MPNSTVQSAAQTHSVRCHVAETVRLAAPLAAAQLSQMAMGLTDTIMLGSLGSLPLAAGGLGAAIFFTLLIVLQGMLTPVSVFTGEARGARQSHGVPDAFATGFLLTVLLAIPAVAMLGMAEPVLRAMGEPPELAIATGRYVDVVRWGAPAALIGMGLMRAFLPAIGQSRLLLWVALAAIGVNAALNYGLIYGVGFLPRLGMLGSAAASAITLWGAALTLLVSVLLRRSTRRAVAGGRSRSRLLCEMARLGWPVSITVGIETTLFLGIGLAIGLISPAALAAHQIAISVSSVVFMVPLGISQASNVRVGFWMGAARPADARRAGFVAIWLGVAFMAAAGLLLVLTRSLVVSLYVDLSAPANAATVRIAVSLLAVAALFAVADGTQVIAAGSLRGLRDTKVPMLLAAAGYWGIGFVVGAVLAFPGGLGAIGLWWGLAAGLTAVGGLLTLRFASLSRAQSVDVAAKFTEAGIA